jgi:UDP-glucose:(heptosyl)LPS alpha-1,3-glucosyltransferase
MDFDGKGLRTIIAALADPKLRTCELLVLGTGPIARFKGIAESLGVNSRIHFLGRRNQIERYYGAGDLFVLPTEYEPFPNVNLEAMACGLPVITTRNSGSIDFLEEGQTGYFLSSRQAKEEFVKIVDQFLRLPENVRQSMSSDCARQAATFTIERNVDSSLSVFNEVLSASPSSEKVSHDHHRLRYVG